MKLNVKKAYEGVDVVYMQTLHIPAELIDELIQKLKEHQMTSSHRLKSGVSRKGD